MGVLDEIVVHVAVGVLLSVGVRGSGCVSGNGCTHRGALGRVNYFRSGGCTRDSVRTCGGG